MTWRTLTLVYWCVSIAWGHNGKTYASDFAANQQHAVIGVVSNAKGEYVSKVTADHWFSKAGPGLFIHMGIASVAGNIDLSWSMIKNTPWDADSHGQNKITPAEYFHLASRFKPDNFHPERFLAAAKDAGFGYAVLTARHHDGFALWPSAFGDFNTSNYLGGRDLVGEYVQACRKAGLRVGLYYSPPDWHRERNYRSWGYRSLGTSGSPHLGMDHQPILEIQKPPADFGDRTAEYINGQLTELLTRYGRIDYLWFDGTGGPKILSIDQIRKLQPDIIVNDRQYGKGDVATAMYECRLPDRRPATSWEYCFSMQACWGYTLPEKCAPTGKLLSALARTRTWGGNVLANFAPRPDGEMPDCFYECMNRMKTWIQHNGQSLIDVKPGPFPEKINVPTTVRGNIWFAHLLSEDATSSPQSGEIIFSGERHPLRACLLANGKVLQIDANARGFVVRVPQALREGLDDVVAIQWADDGTPATLSNQSN